MDFAAQLIKFFNDLRDAAECDYWKCPRTGATPHDENCLTGNPTGE